MTTGPTFAPAAPPVRLVPATLPPRSAPPARAALAKPDAGGSHVLTYLRLHWLTIVFLGALLGAGFAYAAWVLVPPKFESYALFQVASAPSGVSATADPTRGRTDFNTYLKTTAGLFKTELVYTRVLDDLRDNATLTAEKEPIKFLDKELQVETKEGSEIIRLSIRGTNPDDVRAIVKAMSKSYLDQVVERDFKDKSKQLVLLKDQKAAQDKEINSKLGTNSNGVPGQLPPVGGVPLPMPGSVPGQPVVPGGDPDHYKRAMYPKLIDRAAKMKDEMPLFDIRADELRAVIAATKEAMQKLTDDPTPADATEAAKKDEAYLRAKFLADQREAAFREKSLLVNNPTSPTVAAMRFAAESARGEADDILATKAKALEADRRKPLMAKMNQEITLAEANIASLAKRKEAATAALTQVEKELRDTPAPLTSPIPPPPAVVPPKPVADTLLTEVTTQDGMYSKLVAHIIALNMELAGPKRVVEIQPATVPQVADGKKQWLAAGFAGLMGFAVVAGFVLLAETRARKVSSLGELKGTGAAVVGVVPWLPDGATARDPLKRADVNEAIDKLRAFVAQSWLSRGASTVCVTSALGDEGKAFTAFGLASSLAQAGYKVLLADFDLRNPSLHPLAGVPNASGVCELLRGEADFRKTIQILPNGLHFLAAGKWSDDARQAAVGGRLEALLNRLKEPFDCVVLHGTALLTVAESVEVARRSEVVLLCALYRDTRTPMLKRAADRVASMEIPYSGIVYLGATPTEALC